MIHSLRFRLAVGAVVAIGLSLAVVWIVLSRLFTDYVVNQYLTEMTVLSDSLAASVVVKDGKLALTATPSDPRLNLPAGGRYWALEENNTVLERSRSLWDTTISEAKVKPSDYGPFLEATGPDGEAMLVLSQDSMLGEDQGARLRFCIYTAFPRAELEAALSGFHSELLWMLLVTAGMLALAATVQASVGLAPLDRLRQKVIDIRKGDITRMGDEGPVEIRPLVREIDLLLQEREGAIERARSRASDLAHGLKTPLTVISQLAASMEPTSAEMTLKQVDLIRQRADRQLQAARLGVERMTSADVGELAGKLIQVLKPARDVALDWSLDIRGDVRVEADPADMAEALGNILDNASKWARSAIAVNVERQGDDVLATISDDGPGIPPDEQAAALHRGIHGKSANGGSGLGLAITADIAEAYGATLTLGNAATGGLEVALRFPVKSIRRAKVPA